jgi:hypothetical protein
VNEIEAEFKTFKILNILFSSPAALEHHRSGEAQGLARTERGDCGQPPIQPRPVRHLLPVDDLPEDDRRLEGLSQVPRPLRLRRPEVRRRVHRQKAGQAVPRDYPGWLLCKGHTNMLGGNEGKCYLEIF